MYYVTNELDNTKKGEVINMGYKIREVREEHGMSQVELAEKSGVSRATISALENGTLRSTMTSTLEKIAHALGVSINDIFFN